ncbi:MAG: glycosyltransferase family 39 protein [Anaerolineales bacterium]|nr:glycosyltransferase family 39 protein [Anaerolineales bacterium]
MKRRRGEEAQRGKRAGKHTPSGAPKGGGSRGAHFTPHASRLTPHASRFTEFFLLSAIILLYLSLSFYQLDLPGLHYDEAFEAVPALQLWQGQAVTAFRNSGLTIGGHLLPLMTQDYIGALNTYAAIPFIALLGPTPAALRSMSILLGVVTLSLTYLLARQLSGQRWVGLSAALLLAVEPTFIFWNRQGIFVTAVTAAIGLAATLCWLRRIQGGSVRWTAAGAFFFGLGLYAKLLFLWLIAALIGAVILLNLSQWLKRLPEALHWKTDFAVAIPAFLAGCWPLLVYNLQTRGTFLNISQNAATSYYGVNNLAVGPNLLERLRQFGVVLDGSHLWYLGQVISNPLPVYGFGLVLIGVVLKGYFKPPAASFRIALFPFLVISLVILASIGTVSALWITHFAVLMPWPALAIAIGGWFLSQGPEVGDWRLGGKTAIKPGHAPRTTHHVSRFTPHASRLTLLAGLGLLVITNFSSVIRYHGALAESGGLSSHSDAIYDLSHWLDGHVASPVIAMDWGLAAPVTYLTGGRVTPTEVFGYLWESDAELTPRLQRFIAEPATLYLWRAPDEIIFDRSPQFKALYRPLNLEETIEAAFYERSGRPILGVTRLVPQGTATNAPK